MQRVQGITRSKVSVTTSSGFGLLGQGRGLARAEVRVYPHKARLPLPKATQVQLQKRGSLACSPLKPPLARSRCFLPASIE